MATKMTTKSFTKNSINLSRKEKFLIILLIVVVFFWLFNKFVLTAQSAKLDELKQERVSHEEDIMKVNSILGKEKHINEQWSKLNHDVNHITNKYFSDIEQPKILELLNGIIDDGALDIKSMQFFGPDYTSLGEVNTKYLGVSIPFEGTYEDLSKFLSQLGKSPKKLLTSNLSLSKMVDGNLTGQMDLSIYSYDKLMDEYVENAYKPEVRSVIKENPFKPFEGYTEETEDTYIGSGTNIYMATEKTTVLEDFEGEEIFFMPSSDSVTGKVSRFTSSKQGKYSLRTEYFISTENKEERAYILLDDKEIILKYPPSSIGIWAHSYGYSPVILGFRFQDQEGNKIDLELSRGVNWMGWEYIEASPPQDIKLYPLKLDRVYLELSSNKDDYGVMLFDNIEAFYLANERESEGIKNSYLFYVVEYGDTFESISEKFYGSKSRYNAILKQNGLNKNSILEAGQILVIPK